ncbi:MAG TPA: DUF308 domain-containing protein [Solirubrobacteraceae bacterium]|nr:DUF308 domain-containing protein [Solirubrobacteraceae bacterium]
MSQDVDEIRQVARELNGAPGSRPAANGLLRPFLSQIARYWWVELLVGVLWVVIAVVVLKFNHASVVTVGILTGIMFLLFAVEEFALAVVDRGARWLWALFGVLLTAAGIVALIHPRNTFAGFADILGFVFLLIGILWTVQAFTERPVNDLWWLGLISGILMVILAFWVSGEFFLARAATLLVFAGVWAMIKGITDIIRAFQIRELGSS